MNPIKVGHKAASGDLFGKWTLFLMSHKDRLLSTVLICNNLCNIGATLSFVIVFNSFDQILSWDLSHIPSPESWFLTPVLVLFGEMLPKSLFRTYPFRLTLKVIPLLIVFYFLTLPFTWLFSKFTDLFRKEPSRFEESYVTKVREEMVLVALEGAKRGTLFESADVFINNVLKLKDKTIKDIMVSLKEYKKMQIALTGNMLIRDLKNRLPDSNEVLVFDEQGVSPLGSVTMLDIAGADAQKRLCDILKPLKCIEIQKPLLSALQFIKTNISEFYLVCDQDRVVGIVQKMSLYHEIFGKYWDRSVNKNA